VDADPSAGGRPPPVLPPPAGAAPPPGPWRAALGAQLARLERVFDRPFGPDGNPWRHLGALGYFLFWIVAASGVYVYIGFDTRADGAYASVERMSANAFPLGSLARSLHRYASDAFVLVVLLHLVREWLLGRYAHFRRFSWTTGVFSLWLVYASGIGGYWLVWDTLAQYSLIATTEWLDALPFLGQLTRNFDATAKVSDRLFSLLIFLHIGIPLALLATMWVHVQRLARPATTPPRALALGTAGALVALALGKPVASAPPADLATVPGTLALDWFYLGVHAFADAAGAWALWAVLLGATACLLALPWLSREARARRPGAAVVDLANCNGCARCFADCPYAAVTMQPRSDGRNHLRQAVVDADLCAGCGVCAGACPSSTPFRSTAELVTGIDLPQAPIGALRAALEAALDRFSALPAGRRPNVVVFGCVPAHCGLDIRALDDASTAALPMLCAAQLPPSFVEYALRAGADGVLVTGCRGGTQGGDCVYRLGNRWTGLRLAGAREPHLRAAVPRDRVRIAWAGRGDEAQLAGELRAFRASLATVPWPAGPRPKRSETAHARRD
jgi:quinol-cytochrome oxidoreductase complex cytochrome b subunit/coenzyme F420-reducing hydrogenase delta subunit/ferredoxin